MKNLSEKNLETLKMYRKMRRPNAKPHFDFKNLPNSARLTYKMINWRNYKTYVELFGEDESPFVMTEFKTEEAMQQYTLFMLESNRFSGKRGGCDWIIYLKDKTPIGVLHVYDLNMEFYDGVHPKPQFGYAIAEPFRKQGYAFEATTHLLSLIPKQFKRHEILANTHKNNEASISLLQKLGFEVYEGINDKVVQYFYKKLIDGKVPKVRWTENGIVEEFSP
ncbi:MAG: GNAT family N-acetyltransferase [Arcicella sp.]|nr:GNAT family N-acetyltransferase [Arcicella sp.]